MSGTDLVLGADIGGSAIKWVLARGDAIIDEGMRPTPDGPTAVVEAIGEVASGLPAVKAAGIALAGVLDPDGRAVVIPNLRGQWAGYPLRGELSKVLLTPVRTENDALCFSQAELGWGAARGHQNVVFLTLGTGVGGGIAIDGRLYRGHLGRAGHLGHQTVDPAGPRCGCGNRGCVEAYASGPAVAQAAARLGLQRHDTSLRVPPGDRVGDLDPVLVFEQARAGDDLARQVVGRAAGALGIALANACNVLAPELIVLGGGVAQAMDQLLPTIRATLAERVRVAAIPPIVPASLGPKAGAIGAALLAEELTHDEQT
jgi:glucokinase